MNAHLVIPALFWPAPDAAQAHADLRLPALEALIARGRRSAAATSPLERWLAHTYGLAADQGSAPFALQADGGEPGEAIWLRADPCHMRVNRDRLMLSDAATFDITREEAEALAESLNTHFAADGMTFYPMQPERWYVRLASAPRIETTPLDEARGHDIDPLLPRGDDAMRWRKLLNEVQMLLHQQPVNEAREARGEPPINSVWLWGAGRLPAIARRPFQRVRSRDPFAGGLALASGATALPLPDNGTQWLRHASADGVELIVLDALAASASYGDVTQWRERLAALERDWFAPALDALKAGRIGMLTLHALGEHAGIDVETTRQDLRYFWRRAKPLAHYLPEPTPA